MSQSMQKYTRAQIPNYSNTFFKEVESKPSYFPSFIYSENEQKEKLSKEKDRKNQIEFQQFNAKRFKFTRPNHLPIQLKEVCQMEKFVRKYVNSPTRQIQTPNENKPRCNIPSLKSFTVQNTDHQQFKSYSARGARRDLFDYLQE